MSGPILNYEMKNSIDMRICVNGVGAFQGEVGLMVKLVLDVVLVRLWSIEYVTQFAMQMLLPLDLCQDILLGFWNVVQ